MEIHTGLLSFMLALIAVMAGSVSAAALAIVYMVLWKDKPLPAATNAVPTPPLVQAPILPPTKQKEPKKKTIKCDGCNRFTELKTPVREVISNSVAAFIYECQHCKKEITCNC